MFGFPTRRSSVSPVLGHRRMRWWQRRPPQEARWDGLALDPVKPTAAVVYLDVSDGPPLRAGERVEVKLTMYARGREIYNGTKLVSDLRHSRSVLITREERDDQRYGVQIELPPPLAVDAKAQGADRFTLVAEARLRDDEVPECLLPCSGDNRFELRDVRMTRAPLGKVYFHSIKLTSTASAAEPREPAQALARARALFPGGQGLIPGGYRATLDVSVETSRTAADKRCRPYLSEADPASEWSHGRSQEPRHSVPARQSGASQNGRRHISQLRRCCSPSHDDPGLRSFALGNIREVTKDKPRAGSTSPFAVLQSRARPLTSAAHEVGHLMGAPHVGTRCNTTASMESTNPDATTTAVVCRARSSTASKPLPSRSDRRRRHRDLRPHVLLLRRHVGHGRRRRQELGVRLPLEPDFARAPGPAHSGRQRDAVPVDTGVCGRGG